MKFITSTLSFKMSCKTELIFLDASVSLCMTQWVDCTSGFSFRICAMSPFMQPAVDTGAGFPVQTVYTECINNINNVLSGCFPLQTLAKSLCSQINVISVSIYLTKAINFAFPLNLLIQWNEKDLPSFPTTWSTMLVPIVSILQQTVSFDKSTVFNLSAISYGERLFGFTVFHIIFWDDLKSDSFLSKNSGGLPSWH